MKTAFSSIVPAIAGFLLASFPCFGGNPDVGAAIVRQFGESQLQNVVLVTAVADEGDDVDEWKVYSVDPYRADEQLCAIATKEDGRWEAKPDKAGKLLTRVPAQRLDFKRLRADSKEARRIVKQAAARQGVEIEDIDYQLAANDTTGAPEWGLALLDDTGYEVGFCVVSGETGLLLSEDWTPKYETTSPSAQTRAEREGEEAAKRVKKGVRKAWNWTEKAGRKTGSFFRELFDQ